MNLTPSLDYVLADLLLLDSEPKFKINKGENKNMQVEWESSQSKIRYFKGNPKKVERLYVPEELPHLIRSHFYSRQLRCRAVFNSGVFDTSQCPMCIDVENNYKNNPDAYYRHRRKDNYLFNALRYTDTDERGTARSAVPSLELVLWRFSRTTYEDLYNIRQKNARYSKSHTEYDLLITTEMKKAGEKEFTMPHILDDREAVVLRTPETKKAMLEVYNRDKYNIEEVFAPDAPDVVIQKAIETAHKFSASSSRTSKRQESSKAQTSRETSSSDASASLPDGSPTVTSFEEILKGV